MMLSTKIFADLLGVYGILIHGNRSDFERRRETFDELFEAIDRLEGLVADAESLKAIREARVHARSAHASQITGRNVDGGAAALLLSRDAIWSVVLR